MAAPYTISNVSVTKGVFRNVESESGSAVVWKRGNTYTLEYYLELDLVVDIEYDFYIETQSNRDFSLIKPVRTGMLYSNYLLFKNSFNKNPFRKDVNVEYKQFFFGIPGIFRYLVYTGIQIQNTEELEADDFFDGVFSANSAVTLVENVTGFLYGGSGSWWKMTMNVAADADLGQGWTQSRRTDINYIRGDDNPFSGDWFPAESWSALGSKTMTVFIREPDWVYDPPFPPPRPEDYDEDAVWDPKTGAWVDPNALTTLGGGRYGKQIMVLGHKAIYFGDL